MRRYRLRVGLDVDDTLYSCNGYAIALLKEQYGDDPILNVNNIRSWGEQGNLLDKRIPMFSDPEFVRSQPLFEGAREFVRELSKVADVFFVTAVPPQCMSARAERLASDFPWIPTSNTIIGTRKDVINLDILLDDGAHNISNSRVTYPVLLRRPWNMHLSGLLSVNSYGDFMHLVRMVRNSFIEKTPDLTKGGVVCLVGPSGTGKKEIAAALVRDSRFAKPVTTTSRPCLRGEDPNGYRFVDEKAFLEAQEKGEFIETTVYAGHFYGTSDSEIRPIVDSGKIAVIPIDICGAVTLKNLYKKRSLLVFTEKSREAILRNILARPITNEAKIRRIMSLDAEMRNAELCDISVNGDLGTEACVSRIKRKIFHSYDEKAAPEDDS